MAKRTYTDTPETLLEAILAMQEKILEVTPEFEAAPIAVVVEKGDGNEVYRANPFIAEYRALVKDYANAIKAYKEIVGSGNAEASAKLSEIRTKFKVIA